MRECAVDEVSRKDGVIFVGAESETDDMGAELKLALIASDNSGKSSIHDNKCNIGWWLKLPDLCADM